MKVGQLVKINGGSYDDDWPKHRMGIITSDEKDGTYWVTFLGSEERFRFHRYFLLPVVKD
tara:strand:- start:266 stop:445 length:180 start_codon:yes stop_codon:yes gene_type:complete